MRDDVAASVFPPMTIRVRKKGQITLPKRALEIVGWKVGDEIEFTINGPDIVLSKVPHV